MFNDNNIYKLIKRAKDEKCNSEDPMRKIIPNPIKFVYSFTLNSNNEIYSEKEIKFYEEQKNENYSSINIQNKNKKNNFNNEKKNPNDKKHEKNYNNEIINNIIDKSQEKAKSKNNLYSKYEKNLNLDKTINNNKSFEINEIKVKKDKDLLNKKRNIENKRTNIVKNNIIHQIYNSKNINLWEDDESESNINANNNEIKEKKNNNILPIHKQIEFIHKSGDTFKKHNVAIKSEYDKDLDKGKIKKIHKNKIGFKKHKNYFQKISNKNIKRQNMYNQ